MTTKPFARIRAAAIDGRGLNPIFRKTQLQRLHHAMTENASEIQASMAKDSSHVLAEVTAEFWLAVGLLADAYNSLDPAKALKEEYAVAKGTDLADRREAVGIVLIRPAVTGHAFFFGLMSALVPALAVGNCIVVQIENTLLQTPRLVLDIIGKALDHDIFMTTSTEVNEADLGHRSISVLQNGPASSSTSNGRITSDPEARVVAIVERDADLKAAAKALVAARFALRGRSPYAPDVVLVNEWVKEDFLGAVLQEVVAQSARVSQSDRDIKSYGKADAARGFAERARAEARVNVLSSGNAGAVVYFEDRKSAIFGDKIQEPCLAVHGVTSMDDAIDSTASFGNLGAAYIFAAPPAAKYITQFIDSPTSFVNHIPLEILCWPLSSSEWEHFADGSASSSQPDGFPDEPPHPTIIRLTTYSEELLSLPKSVFVSPSKDKTLLQDVLSNPKAQHLSSLLSQKLSAPITMFKRVEEKTDIGFFNQGIVTGAVMFLSTVAVVGGYGCYYGLRFLRPFVFSG